MPRILKPFTSIFDTIDVPFIYFSFVGILAFSKHQTCDVTGIFAMLGFIMVFFFSPYEMETTKPMVHTAFYKLFFFFKCAGGALSKWIMTKRTDLFLKSLHLIDEVDEHLKERHISVSYRSAKNHVVLALCYPFYMFPTLIRFYYDEDLKEEDRIYNMVHISFVIMFSYAQLGLEALYLVIIATTTRNRLQLLCGYMDKLEKLKNSKMVQQEILVISRLHFKLCQSWKFAVQSHGHAMIILLVLFYTYTLVPLAFFGYLFPRLKGHLLIPFFYLSVYIFYIILQFESLKTSVGQFESDLMKLCLMRISNDNVHIVCKTLLLQIKHWNIDFVFGGCITMDLKWFLEGLKTTSTIMMFIVQMSDE